MILLSQSYTFIEGGYFVPIMCVLFAVAGLAIETKMFKKLGTYEKGVWKPIIFTIGGFVLGWGVAILLRMVF